MYLGLFLFKAAWVTVYSVNAVAFMNYIFKNSTVQVQTYVYRRNVIPFSRPGGELNPGEDEVEGLKRLLTEVLIFSPSKINISFTAEYAVV
jgi:hypothetical protein